MPATNVLEVVGLMVVNGEVSLRVVDYDVKEFVVPLDAKLLNLSGTENGVHFTLDVQIRKVNTVLQRASMGSV